MKEGRSALEMLTHKYIDRKETSRRSRSTQEGTVRMDINEIGINSRN